MKKFFTSLFLLVAVTATGGDFVNYPNIPGFVGSSGLSNHDWWNDSSLIFWAPINDVNNPLKLYKGIGLFTFSRVHDATHTATFVHPITGIVTITSADQPRIEAQGALFEEGRSNLYTYSEQFNNAVWTAGIVNLTVTPDNAVAPDGTLTADLVVLDNGIGGGPVGYFNRTVSLVAPYSISVYLKYAGKDVLVLQDGSGNGAIFNLTAKTATVIGGVFVSASIQEMSSGWYRCKINYVTGAEANPHFFSYFNTEGDGVSGMYFWGAQLESGVPTSSYIPSVSSIISRNADVLTIPSSGNIDNDAGTLAFDFIPGWNSTDTVGSVVLFDGGLKATYTSVDRKINFTDGINTVSSTALTFSSGVSQKLSFRWGLSGLAIYRNGTELGIGVSYTVFTPNKDFYIGADTASVNQIFSHLINIRSWNKEFTNFEMQSITQ